MLGSWLILLHSAVDIVLGKPSSDSITVKLVVNRSVLVLVKLIII